MFTVNRQRFTQPQQAVGIARHWKARGLNSCLLGNGTLNLTDAITGALLTPTVGTNLSPSAGTAGRAVYGSSNTGSSGYYSPRASFGQNFTLLVLGGNFTGTATVAGLIDNDRGTLAPADKRHWQFRIYNNAVDFIRFDTAGNAYTATTATVADFIKPGVYVARSAGADMKVWAPGVAPATQTIANTPTTHNSNEADYQLRGIRFDLTQYFPVGDIYLAATFDSALTDSEIASLIGNPWQILTPRKRQIYVSAASGGISGALSQTLGDASASSTSTVKIAGTASPTLGAVTSSATGTVAIVGTSSTTLDAATLAATGVLSAPGTGVVNQSLSDATLSATGTVSIVGSASVNLGALGLSSAAAIRINASLAQTLASATLSATGASLGTISGVASVTLDSLTLSAAGQGLWADVARASTVWADVARASTVWTDAAGASGIWTEI